MAPEEITHLQNRLAAAETVCVLYGWTGSPQNNDNEKAALQAWMDWSHLTGRDDRPKDWQPQIEELARRRDDIRAQTITRIRDKYGPAAAGVYALGGGPAEAVVPALLQVLDLTTPEPGQTAS